jgi:hypothetical protein
MAAVVPLKRGDTWEAEFYFRLDDSVADLTGCTARMQVRSSGDALVLSAQTSPTDPALVGTLVVDGTAGLVTLTVPKGLTSALVPGKYYADVELTYADGSVRSSETFQVKVTKDITL